MGCDAGNGVITPQLMTNKRSGKIYILRNSSYKGTIVKIGRTARIAEARAKELSAGTGVPVEFEVLYEEDVFDCVQAEKIIHKILQNDRINVNREFFRLPLKKAVKVVFEVCLKVNKSSKKEAGTRIVIVMGLLGSISEKKMRMIKEIISNHKGIKTAVHLLFNTSTEKQVIIQVGEDLNVALSPALINSLKNIRGVKDVFWISRDLKQIADFEATEKMKPIEIDWEN